MYKRIDFSILGGFPAVQETFNWMQDSYRTAISSIAKMFGDKVIVYGCMVNGNNVTDGAVVISGELMPFVGGAYQAGDKVIVLETPEAAVTFQDNNQHQVYFTKVARIGSPGGFPFTDLRPANIGTPLGLPEMFAGPVAKLPTNYGLCDGALLNIADYPALFDVIGNLHGGDGVNTFALPNLKSRFVVGYDPGDVDYNNIGKIGGEKTHQLSSGELPKTEITPSLYYGKINWGNKNSNEVLVKDNSDKVTGSGKPNTPAPNTIGNDQPHENRPPYYTLAFIIRLK